MYDKINSLALAWDSTYKVPGRKRYLADNQQAPNIAKTNFLSYAQKPSTRVLSFLGLAIGRPPGEHPRAWRDRVSMALNIVMFIPNLAKNVVKLLTEFLPLAGYVKMKSMNIQYSGVGRNHSKPKAVVTQILAGIAYGLYFIGRAVTSPSRGIRKAYKMEPSFSVIEKQRTVSNRVAGVALAVFSGLITAAVYTIALPFIVGLAAPSLVAAGATLVAKSAIASAAVKGFALVGSYLTTALQAIGVASIPAAVVGVSSLTATAATAGCVVASEVDIHRKRKGSTAKMAASMNGKPGNGHDADGVEGRNSLKKDMPSRPGRSSPMFISSEGPRVLPSRSPMSSH